MKQKNRFIIFILALLLLVDLGYSYYQYAQSQIDGDFAIIVLGGEPYNTALNDPLGIHALQGEKYAGTNRFTALAFMSTYFKTLPLAFQILVSPIESVYASIAITKLWIHIAILFLLSYYASSWNGFSWKNFLMGAILLSPFFHAGPIYYEYMALIDPTITYTMFYALPMVFVLVYFLPFYQYFRIGKISRNHWFLIGWLVYTIFLVLFGPLTAPIVLIFCFTMLSFVLVKNFFLTSGSDPVHRFLKGIKAVDKSIMFFLIFGFAVSLYSIYIGTKNSENFWYPKSLEDRYSLLPKGLFESFLNIKHGILLFMVAAIVNILLLYKFYKARERKYFKLLFFLLIFSFIYIFLLPLGGFRVYRPFILRRDTILPILLILMFVWSSSGIMLLHYLKKSGKKFYLALLFPLLIFYTLKDEVSTRGNLCEKKLILEIAQSSEDCVVLHRKCSVASWGFYEECSQNERAATLFEYYNIFPRKILYRFEKPAQVEN